MSNSVLYKKNKTGIVTPLDDCVAEPRAEW